MWRNRVLAILVILALALTACAQATPQVVEKIVKETVVVKETSVVEKVVEKQATVVVEKQVTKEVVKEVTKVVEVGQKAQTNPFLSWDLKGGTVVTDPAKMPKAFKEAPALAALVKDGKLPPVNERLPKEPLVMQPLEKIGKYGGTIRMAVFNNNPETMNRPSSMDKLIFWDATGNKLVPSLAKSWEVSADGKTTTVNLRQGVKWSDGKPFTTADIKFWWDDIYYNKEIYPSLSPDTATPGGQGELVVVDDYTLKFVFKDPYFMFPEVLAAPFSVVGSGRSLSIWLPNYGPIVPAHYLKQFHPKYAAKADLDKLIKDNKVTSWVELITLKNDWSLNVDAPVLGPWKTVQPMKTAAWILERNPYFWEVDTEGNQLPYIDQFFLTSVSSMETTNLKAIAGEFDFQYRDLTVANLPALLENGAKRGYKVFLDPVTSGSSFVVYVNQSYQKDPEIAKWLTNVDFRRALSMGIDRNEFNQVFYLGLGRPGSQVVDESSPESPGKEYRDLWSKLDVAQANALLDKIGLSKKDAQGYRLRTDNGQKLTLEILGPTDPPDYAKKYEMLQQHWKKIGIDLRFNIVPYDQWGVINATNEAMLNSYTNWGTERLWGESTATGRNVTFTYQDAEIGPAFGTWYATKGAKGIEPKDPLIKQVQELYTKGWTSTLEERNKLGQQIWKIAIEQQWGIGVVGGFGYWPRLANNDLGNVPTAVCFASYCRFPAAARVETFFWNR
jgi:peptide/nickel transport system substrate-binding protein